MSWHHDYGGLPGSLLSRLQRHCACGALLCRSAVCSEAIRPARIALSPHSSIAVKFSSLWPPAALPTSQPSGQVGPQGAGKTRRLRPQQERPRKQHHSTTLEQHQPGQPAQRLRRATLGPSDPSQGQVNGAAERQHPSHPQQHKQGAQSYQQLRSGEASRSSGSMSDRMETARADRADGHSTGNSRNPTGLAQRSATGHVTFMDTVGRSRAAGEDDNRFVVVSRSTAAAVTRDSESSADPVPSLAVASPPFMEIDMPPVPTLPPPAWMPWQSRQSPPAQHHRQLQSQRSRRPIRSRYFVPYTSQHPAHLITALARASDAGGHSRTSQGCDMYNNDAADNLDMDAGLMEMLMSAGVQQELAEIYRDFDDTDAEKDDMMYDEPYDHSTVAAGGGSAYTGGAGTPVVVATALDVLASPGTDGGIANAPQNSTDSSSSSGSSTSSTGSSVGDGSGDGGGQADGRHDGGDSHGGGSGDATAARPWTPASTVTLTEALRRSGGFFRFKAQMLAPLYERRRTRNPVTTARLLGMSAAYTHPQAVEVAMKLAPPVAQRFSSSTGMPYRYGVGARGQIVDLLRRERELAALAVPERVRRRLLAVASQAGVQRAGSEGGGAGIRRVGSRRAHVEEEEGDEAVEDDAFNSEFDDAEQVDGKFDEVDSGFDEFDDLDRYLGVADEDEEDDGDVAGEANEGEAGLESSTNRGGVSPEPRSVDLSVSRLSPDRVSCYGATPRESRGIRMGRLSPGVEDEAAERKDAPERLRKGEGLRVQQGPAEALAASWGPLEQQQHVRSTCRGGAEAEGEEPLPTAPAVAARFQPSEVSDLGGQSQGSEGMYVQYDMSGEFVEELYEEENVDEDGGIDALVDMLMLAGGDSNAGGDEASSGGGSGSAGGGSRHYSGAATAATQVPTSGDRVVVGVDGSDAAAAAGAGAPAVPVLPVPVAVASVSNPEAAAAFTSGAGATAVASPSAPAPAISTADGDSRANSGRRVSGGQGTDAPAAAAAHASGQLTAVPVPGATAADAAAAHSATAAIFGRRVLQLAPVVSGEMAPEPATANKLGSKAAAVPSAPPRGGRRTQRTQRTQRAVSVASASAASADERLPAQPAGSSPPQLQVCSPDLQTAPPQQQPYVSGRYLGSTPYGWQEFSISMVPGAEPAGMTSGDSSPVRARGVGRTGTAASIGRGAAVAVAAAVDGSGGGRGISTGTAPSTDTPRLMLRAFLYCLGRDELYNALWRSDLFDRLEFVTRLRDADIVLHRAPGRGEKQFALQKLVKAARSVRIPFVTVRQPTEELLVPALQRELRRFETMYRKVVAEVPGKGLPSRMPK